MTVYKFLNIVLLALLAFIAFNTSAAQALSVDAIRLGAHPDKTRLVFDLSDSSDFRAFTLDDPYRLVIDLPDFDWRAPEISLGANTGITSLRHGHLEASISRIVFDMSKPYNIQGAFLIPRQDGKSDRLVVDLVQADHGTFIKERGKIYGNLTLSPSATLDTPSFGNIDNAVSPNTNSPNLSPPRKPDISQNASNRPKPLIVIDPGHGGVDPGAIGANGAHEKKVVLALSKALKEELESAGQYHVLLTRENDVFIKLAERVKFARKHGADLFVSVHADSLPRPNVRGTSIYTLSDKASDEQTEKLAARENKADLIAGLDLSVEDQEVANILVNLAMRDTMNQSKFFANTVVATFDTNGLNLLEKPHRYAGFAVLKAPDIPSVLVEAGFMSNRQEADMLATSAYQRKFAISMHKAIDAYFNTVSQNDQN